MKNTIYFVIVVVLIGLAVSHLTKTDEDKPELDSTEISPALTRPLGETKPASKQTIETERRINPSEADPTKDLEERWQEELKDYLMIIAPNEAADILDQYLAAKRELTARAAPLESELQKYSSATNFEDKKKYIEIDKALDGVREEYKAKIKVIFGPHYQTVQAFYEDHLESIQVHHNGEGKIGLDIGFSD